MGHTVSVMHRAKIETCSFQARWRCNALLSFWSLLNCETFLLSLSPGSGRQLWLASFRRAARRVRGLPSWSNPSRLQRPTCFARRTHSFGFIERRSTRRMLTIRAFEIQQMVLHRPDRGPACRRQAFITHIKTHALLKQVRSCEPNSAFVHLPM